VWGEENLPGHIAWQVSDQLPAAAVAVKAGKEKVYSKIAEDRCGKTDY
jgi:hypothetical protein